jgi:hypothetical protein
MNYNAIIVEELWNDLLDDVSGVDNDRPNADDLLLEGDVKGTEYR